MKTFEAWWAVYADTNHCHDGVVKMAACSAWKEGGFQERRRLIALADEVEATYETREDDPVHGKGTVVEYHNFGDLIRSGR